MKQIRLKRMTLNNFKGFTFTLDANGEDLSVMGANATGKTTLADAFSYLLFGKDSLSRSTFEIKNLDVDGNAQHGLDHSVEALLQIDDITITLKKVHHEVWSKKRGSAQSTLTGNTVDHYIDGVPTKENEYKARMAEIAGDETIFRLLTSPTVFPALPWQRQRALLLEVCGDVTDAQVIATDDSLAPLSDLLKRYTVSKTPLEDLKKVVTSRRTEINKNLDQLPVRIDEVYRGLPDISGLNLNTVTAVIDTIETEINDAKLRLQGIDNGAGIADLAKQLQGLKYDISQLENKYYLEGMKHVVQMNARINELQAGKDTEIRRTNDMKAELSRDQARMVLLESDLQVLREKWTTIDAEVFHDTTEDICPACGQSLPSDRVQDARDKALAQFNQSKAERMLAVETRGKELRTQLDVISQSAEELYGRLIYRENQVSDTDELAMLTAERDILKARAEDYTGIPGRPEMLERKAGIEKQIEAARGGVSQDKDAIQKEITDLTAQLAEAKADADRFTRREQGERRVEELKAEEKKLAKEFEDLEKQLFLIESFTKRKVSLLNERINARFHLVRFKLFNQLVNGGIEDCCEITVNGVPFGGGLNSAARTQAGCEIINILQEHYNIAPAVWLDNRESCTLIPDMKCQVISLYVSPEDKTLRIQKAQSGGKLAA